MLIEQTLMDLRRMKLQAMAHALEHQRTNAAIQDLPFDDRFSMIIDAERHARENRRLNRLVKGAKFKASASAEDVDYRATRGLDKRKFSALLSCDWIERGQHLIMTGPTGVGKTWLACALGNQAVRRGLPVIYRRFIRLLEEFEIARADGSLPKLRGQIAKARLVILDDWGVSPLTAMNRQDLMELIDDRTGAASVLITAQLPVAQWHDYLGEPTIADAILDRLVHGAHRIELLGESMRKLKAHSGEK
jgi:DNA replication protein DnaC